MNQELCSYKSISAIRGVAGQPLAARFKANLTAQREAGNVFSEDSKAVYARGGKVAMYISVLVRYHDGSTLRLEVEPPTKKTTVSARKSTVLTTPAQQCVIVEVGK